MVDIKRYEDLFKNVFKPKSWVSSLSRSIWKLMTLSDEDIHMDITHGAKFVLKYLNYQPYASAYLRLAKTGFPMNETCRS